MNDFQRSKLDRLIYDSLQTGQVVSATQLAEARGYINGLLEGANEEFRISPEDYSEYSRQIRGAEQTIFDRVQAKIRMAS